MPSDASALSRVAAQVAASERVSKEAADNARAREEASRVLAAEGTERIRSVLRDLLERVKREAGPAAQLEQHGKAIRLGGGRLVCDLAFPYLESEVFQRSGWPVVAGVFLGVRQDSRRYPGRSANLWYGDLGRSGAYHWWEVAYMGHSLAPSYQRPDTPFGISDASDLKIADAAACASMDVYQYAYQPTRVEGEQLEPFLRRWMGFLAAAATRSLETPRYLPEGS